MSVSEARSKDAWVGPGGLARPVGSGRAGRSGKSGESDESSGLAPASPTTLVTPPGCYVRRADGPQRPAVLDPELIGKIFSPGQSLHQTPIANRCAPDLAQPRIVSRLARDTNP